MADQRTYTAGRFVLDINGENAGYLKKVEGGHMEADIAENPLGGDNVYKKHVANIKWAPIKATIGIGMGSELYTWVRAAFDKGYITKSGSLTAADFNYKAQSVMTFTDALITSLTVPKMDGASKDAAYFDVEFDAEQVRWSKGGGEDIRTKVGPKQKAWLASNFAFEMGGLPCTRVASIESFTWKCSVVPDQLGAFKEPTKHPANVKVPDVTVSVSRADYDAWAQEAKKWFVDGQHLEEHEMSGRIVFLNPNMKDEIGHIELQNCGFKSFKNDTFEANSEKVSRFTATFYVERMLFKLNYFDSAK